MSIEILTMAVTCCNRYQANHVFLAEKRCDDMVCEIERKVCVSFAHRQINIDGGVIFLQA